MEIPSIPKADKGKDAFGKKIPAQADDVLPKTFNGVTRGLFVFAFLYPDIIGALVFDL